MTGNYLNTTLLYGKSVLAVQGFALSYCKSINIIHEEFVWQLQRLAQATSSYMYRSIAALNALLFLALITTFVAEI